MLRRKIKIDLFFIFHRLSGKTLYIIQQCNNVKFRLRVSRHLKCRWNKKLFMWIQVDTTYCRNNRRYYEFLMQRFLNFDDYCLEKSERWAIDRWRFIILKNLYLQIVKTILFIKIKHWKFSHRMIIFLCNTYLNIRYKSVDIYLDSYFEMMYVERLTITIS